MTSAAHAYEMPEDDEHLNRLVAGTSSGNVVYLTRLGRPALVVQSVEDRLRDLEAAVEATEGEVRRVVHRREAIEAILAAMEDDARNAIERLLDAMHEDAEDAVDAAHARLTLARIEAGIESVVPWDEALAELADQ